MVNTADSGDMIKPLCSGFLLPVVLSWSPFLHPDHSVRVITCDYHPDIVPVCRAASASGEQAIPASWVMSDPVSWRVAMTMRSAVRITVFSRVKSAHVASVG